MVADDGAGNAPSDLCASLSSCRDFSRRGSRRKTVESNSKSGCRCWIKGGPRGSRDTDVSLLIVGGAVVLHEGRGEGKQTVRIIFSDDARKVSLKAQCGCVPTAGTVRPSRLPDQLFRLQDLASMECHFS